jgi:hypothetical protein
MILHKNELPSSKMQGIHYQVSPPLPARPGPGMGGDQGEGEQRFNHPHLSSPIEGEEQYSDPVASYRELSS